MRLDRPYQTSAKAEIIDRLKTSEPLALILGTGSGKTYTIASLVAHSLTDQFQKIWILCHQDPLPSQWVDTLGDCKISRVGAIVSKDTQGTFKRKLPFGSEQIVVVMTPTLRSRLKKIKPEDLPDLIIVDECHKTGFHLVTQRLRDACLGVHGDRFREVGVTATPLRHPKESRQFEAVYPKDGWIIPTGSTPHDFTENRWWKPRTYLKVSPEWLSALAEEVDRQAEISEEGSDSESSLVGSDGEVSVSKQTRVFLPLSHRAIAEWEAHQTPGLTRQTFWATCSRIHALALLQALRERSYSAEVVMGDVGDLDADELDTEVSSDRDAILAAYDRLEFQHLIVVGCLREGYDCPPISSIVLLRIFGCYHDILQICGRGFRPYSDAAGEMLDCQILDLGVNFGTYPYPDHYDPITYLNAKRMFIDLDMEICGVCHFNHKAIPSSLDGDDKPLHCHDCGEPLRYDLEALIKFGAWRRSVRQAIAAGTRPPRPNFQKSGLRMAPSDLPIATPKLLRELGVWKEAAIGQSFIDFERLKRDLLERTAKQYSLATLEEIKKQRVDLLPEKLKTRAKQTVADARSYARKKTNQLPSCIKGAIQICYLLNQKPSLAWSVFPDDATIATALSVENVRPFKRQLFKSMQLEAVKELVVCTETQKAVWWWLQSMAEAVMNDDSIPSPTRWAQYGSLKEMGEAIGAPVSVKKKG